MITRKQILLIGLVLALILCVVPVSAYYEVLTPNIIQNYYVGLDQLRHPVDAGHYLSTSDASGFHYGWDEIFLSNDNGGFCNSSLATTQHFYFTSISHAKTYLYASSVPAYAGYGGYRTLPIGEGTYYYNGGDIKNYTYVYATFDNCLLPGDEYPGWEVSVGNITHVPVTFSVSDNTSFSTKLANVSIVISNGQSGVTNSSGMLDIAVTPPSSAYTYSLTKAGYLTKTGEALGGYGSTGGVVYNTMTAGTAGNITHVILDVVDSQTFFSVSGVTVGIKNLTSGVWRNSSQPSGSVMFDSTGANHEFPLSKYQVVGYGASAFGYLGGYEEVTLLNDYQENYLPLTKISNAPVNGTWNLVVDVKENYDHTTPISGVMVVVSTGVNPPPLRWTDYTASNGVVSFLQKTPSTIASIDISKLGYKNLTDVISTNPNGTSYKHYELVRDGSVWIGPTATPVGPTPTQTVGPGATMIQPTDSHGQIITDPSAKGTAAFMLLVDAAYSIMSIAVGLLLIWLLWMTVYLITGGDIIKKIMNRRR